MPLAHVQNSRCFDSLSRSLSISLYILLSSSWCRYCCRCFCSCWWFCRSFSQFISSQYISLSLYRSLIRLALLSDAFVCRRCIAPHSADRSTLCALPLYFWISFATRTIRSHLWSHIWFVLCLAMVARVLVPTSMLALHKQTNIHTNTHTHTYGPLAPSSCEFDRWFELELSPMYIA